MTRGVPAWAPSFVLALAAALAGAACSTPGPAKPTFQRRFERSRSLPGSKAMAVAGDVHGRFASGIGYGYLSTGLAIDKALEECNVWRRSWKVASPCRLYAVEDQVVDGNPRLEARYGRR
jgi:hypothetical protein